MNFNNWIEDPGALSIVSKFFINYGECAYKLLKEICVELFKDKLLDPYKNLIITLSMYTSEYINLIFIKNI